MKERVYIHSLGCPKNQVDAEVMAGLLAGSGYEMVPGPEEAEVIVVNTCAFILSAKQEAVEEILTMAGWKERGACRRLIVTGCLPQRYGRVLEKEMPEVDLFLGTGDFPRIVELLRKSGRSSRRSFVGRPRFLMDAGHHRLLAPSPASAYLKVAEGCSNRCSYCVIPRIRGKFRSRPPEDVLEEAEALALAGVKEVVLVAQDTTAYGRDLAGRPLLADLLRELAAVPGFRWIRFLYAYPSSVTDELLEVVAREEKVCKYIDIPVQHIDDGILRAMKRKGGSAEVRDAVGRIRRMVPEAVLRTSVIVGFPGETAARFNRLLEFVEEARFENLGAFTYSREEGTEAAGLAYQVSERVKEKRRDLLMERQAAISFEVNRRRIGRVEEVLLEGETGDPVFPLLGRTRTQAPEVDGFTYVRAKKGEIGDIVFCRVVDADTYDLYAEETS
ncbi:MAG TPA: 30S ribosomal protein S12 methylthiotransferase RimO [Syntrophales bacterium]|nr:30S ribosomal protein S12 methylthiotransferase RimO [Syntrophales bacterium]HRT70450.1 30S ribosomal protein S12 methylthiotransferase RimO [Syntrophales bacterium]